MTLSEISIRHHVLAYMLSGVLVLFGLISSGLIGIDRYPYIEFPVISVTTTLQGANPEIVDASITNILETSINAISGINHIQSRSFPGVSTVLIAFVLDKDIDVGFNEVQAKVNQVLRELPDDVDPPIVAKVGFGVDPVLWLSLRGDRTLQQINEYARTVIKKRLENVTGVAEVRLGGERRRMIRVNLDPARMNAYGITTRELLQALHKEHIQLPGGFLTARDQDLLIKLDLEFHHPSQLQAMVVSYREGAPIRLRDIAQVEDGLADRRELARYNGIPTVGIGIIPITHANTVAVVDEVKRRLEHELVPALPEGMSLTVANDAALLIEDIIVSLKEHLLLAVVLTALVVWAFLKSLRATLIIATAIPVSLLGAIAAMYFAGFTFNTMTLLALLLLIGVVVDDAIVVLENIYRHREDVDPATAALKGTHQVVFPVMASTLTLVCIFAPVIFMEGVIGRFFKSFAVVVTIGVLVSLFVSLTLTPMLCSRHLGGGGRHGPVYRLMEAVLRGMDNGYRRLLGTALRYRWSVVLLTVGIVLSSGYFFAQIGKGFLPQEDEGRFLISFKTPLGSSLDYTASRLDAIEVILRRHPQIEGYFSLIGSGVQGQVNRGLVYVQLTPQSQRGLHQYTLIDRLRDELAVIPGVKAFPAPFPIVGGQRGEPLQFVLTGPDLGEVDRLSHDLLKVLQTNPALGEVDLDLQLELPQVALHVDRVRARSLGIASGDVALALNVLAGGLDVAKYNDLPGRGERYEVRIQAREGYFRSPTDLRNIYLRSRGGTLVRLDTIATLEETLGPAAVSRFDLQYSGNFYSTPTVSLGSAVRQVEAIAQESLPIGYRVQMIGRAEEFAKTAKYTLFAFTTALILVYMVLASQFDSFTQPLIIMVAQPLAVVGGILGLWLTGMTLNIFSMIGLVLLVGLVSKNSILLVDLTNRYRNQGLEVGEALLTACPIRLRPVLMTSLTIIFSLLPAALGIGAGADTNGPLAVAVIGGMISSTFLTLVVVPAVYSLVERGLARIGDAGKAGEPSTDQEPPERE